MNDFKDYLETKHNYIPRLLEKEKLTGLYDEFYFKNHNNKEFICQTGESWTKGERKTKEIFNIYKQTQEFINQSPSKTLEEEFQRLSIIDISDESHELKKPTLFQLFEIHKMNNKCNIV